MSLRSLTFSAILCTLVFAVTCQSVRPLIRLMNSGPENPEFSINTIYSLPDVAKYHRELNDVRVYCLTGTWVFHSQVNHSGSHTFFTAETEVCDSYPWPPVSSVRHVGWTGDIYEPTFNVYSGYGYSGNETFFMTHYEKNIKTEFESLIITGNRPITLYARQDQTGLSMCVGAPSNGLSGGIKNLTETLGIFPGDIQSFDFGCEGSGISRIFKLDSVPEKKEWTK